MFNKVGSFQSTAAAADSAKLTPKVSSLEDVFIAGTAPLIKPAQEYPLEVTKQAKEYGFKTANLMYLKDQVLTDSYALVPTIKPIKSDDITKHLDTHAPTWRTLWQEFVSAQGEGGDVIKPEAATKLENLQKAVQAAFIDNQFETDSIENAKLLMIRSTGNEDRVDVANPGGNESVVSANTKKEISSSIGTVIASYFSHKSMFQRLKSGEDVVSSPPLCACLIQTLVGELDRTKPVSSENLPPISGVMYTENGRIRIQAAHGHGELVVNSRGNFDSYYINKENAVYSSVMEKKFRLVPELDQTTQKMELVHEDNPIALATTRCFSDSVACQLAKTARKIEQAYKMRMDIEFVYDPNTNQLNIVQARAVSDERKKAMKPSALSREYIASHPNLERVKGSVITPEIQTAQIIKNSNEILICDTIEQALNAWPNKKNIKAVIIQRDAPDTSHIAGMFNNSGISVMQVQNFDQVSQWSKKMDGKDILIVDPQNSSIFKLASTEDTSQIIQEGVFKSTLTLHVSPPKASVLTKDLAANLKPLLKVTAVQPRYDSKTLSADLEQLSLAELGKDNAVQKAKLSRLTQSAHFAWKNNRISTVLFQKIGSTARELNSKFSEIEMSKLDPNSAEGRVLVRDYLNIQKKFEGLFTSEAKKEMLSTSVIRELAVKKAAKKYVVPADLAPDQAQYYKELVKLKSKIAREDKGEEWTHFCATACKNNEGPMLAALVADLIRLDLHEHWVNTEFLNHDKSPENLALVHKLHTEYNQPETKARREALVKASQVIDEMEHQIGNFADPAKFTKQFEVLKSNIAQVDQVLHQKDTDNLNLLLATKQSMRMVDIFDKSIKALQTSSEYTQEQKVIQVQRFKQMVTEFMSMLQKRVDDNHRTHFGILSQKMSSLTTDSPEQLNISPNFSAIQTNVYSGQPFGNISRAMPNTKSAADLHSAIHQSLISFEVLRTKTLNNSIKPHLPDSVTTCITQVEAVRFGSQAPDLISITFMAPSIKLEYNVSLRTHSANMQVSYNTKTKTFNIGIVFYGRNDSRWNTGALFGLSALSRTDARVHQCESNNSSLNIEVETKNVQEVLSIFSSLAIGTFSDNMTISNPLSSNTSPAFESILKSGSNIVLNNNAKKLFLQKTEREKLTQQLKELNLGKEKDFLLQSYNGLVLFKNKVLTEERINQFSKEKLAAICSDRFLVVYSQYALHEELLKLDAAKINALTFYKAIAYYRDTTGQYPTLDQLKKLDAEKILSLTSDNAIECYRDTTGQYPTLDQLKKLDAEKILSLTSYNAMESYRDTTGQYPTLVQLKELDTEKILSLTSYNAMVCYQAGIKFGVLSGIYDNDQNAHTGKFRALTSNDARACYRDTTGQCPTFDQLKELDERKILSLTSEDARACYQAGIKFGDLSGIYDNEQNTHTGKFIALTSNNAIACYRYTTGKYPTFDQLKELEERKIFSLTSEGARACYRDTTGKYPTFDQLKGLDARKIWSLTSEGARACYHDTTGKYPTFDQLKGLDARKIWLLTSEGAIACYHDTTGKYPTFDQLIELDEEKILAFVEHLS